MKLWKLGPALLVLGAAAIPTLAQEGNQQGERLQRALQRFDKDGDGKLNDEERAAAREAFQGDSAPAARPAGERGQGERGQGERRPEGRGGEAAQVFERLDQNKD